MISILFRKVALNGANVSALFHIFLDTIQLVALALSAATLGIGTYEGDEASSSKFCS